MMQKLSSMIDNSSLHFCHGCNSALLSDTGTRIERNDTRKGCVVFVKNIIENQPKHAVVGFLGLAFSVAVKQLGKNC